MSTIREQILESLEPVIEKPKQVRINEQNIESLAKELKSEEVPAWNNDDQFKGTVDQTLHYYFFLNSINFCFWNLKGRGCWEFCKEDRWVSGYFACSYAVKKAFEEHEQFFDAEYCANLPFSVFFDMLNGRNELLLIEERYESVTANYRVVHDAFKGKVSEILAKGNYDANEIVPLLAKKFPAFRDVGMTKKRKKILFYKNAQQFVSDISFALQDESEFEIKNLQDLTVFPSYRLPQILETLGVFDYGLSVKSKLMNEQIIEPNHELELELRAQTIVAGEKLTAALKKEGKEITARELDLLLWHKARETVNKRSHHKTISTFY